MEANDIGQSCSRAVSGQGGAGLDLDFVQQVIIDLFLYQGQGGHFRYILILWIEINHGLSFLTIHPNFNFDEWRYILFPIFHPHVKKHLEDHDVMTTMTFLRLPFLLHFYWSLSCT